jgi:alpha-tubulin suppressor-like RCC1 family protein
MKRLRLVIAASTLLLSSAGLYAMSSGPSETLPPSFDPATGGYAPLADWVDERGREIQLISVGDEQLKVIQIGEGNSFTCAVTMDSAVMCWGRNALGQLGNNTSDDSVVPVIVPDLEPGVTSISVGRTHACVVTTEGAAKCWGGNVFSQLGDGTTMHSLYPQQVIGLERGVLQVSAGERHSCAILEGGAVKCWGDNRDGQLGTGDRTARTMPDDVAGLTGGVVAISADDTDTCAILNDRSSRCWGFNVFGQVDPGLQTHHLVPTEMSPTD